MRAATFLFSLCIAAQLPLAVFAQSPPLSGRWEGKVDIPGAAMTLVVDLAPGESGHWSGSLTVPGYDVKGAPLADLEVKDSDITFAIPSALGGAKVKAQLSSDALQGEFTLAGNSAAFILHKTGVAQVDLPRTSTRVRADWEGAWSGTITYNGGPVQVKVTLSNGEQAASATFVLARTKETPFPVGLITQEGSNLNLQAAGGQINLDANYDSASNELRGMVQIGGVDCPVVLRKGSAK